MPMRSHSPLKSSKIIGTALRSFKKKKKREKGKKKKNPRYVSCMWICINMMEELK